MEKLERLLLPFANKLAASKYLSAIRDGFVAIMPIMIIGSFFILINSVVIGPNGFLNKLLGLELLVLTQLGGAIIPATMSIMGLLLTFTTSKSLCEQYKEDTTIIPAIAVVCLVVLTPVVFDATLNIEYINTFYLGAAGMFMSFIASILATELIRNLSKLNALIIKMPDSVPPSIARSFNKLIPVMITILIFGLIRMATNIIGTPLNDLVFQLIQTPFTNIVTSPLGLVIIYILYMLLWGM